jgi:DNA-binding transcriptional ArsR family regulator
VLLARHGEQSAGALAARFAISRPAVSKHLAVLRRAGLVHERQEGREHLYALRPEPLRDIVAWLDAMDRFWAERMDALGAHLAE